jgi:hypothetical protein
LIRKLLAFAFFALATSADAQQLRVANAQITSDTSTFDVTWSGAGTPTGVFICGTYATALDTNTDDAGFFCGVTDFTNEGVIHFNAEDGQATTDTGSEHSSSLIGLLTTPGTGSDIRTLTGAAAITDGVRITPGQSGTQYRLMVIGVFTDGFYAFSSCAGVTTDTACDITHGLANAPEAGIFFAGTDDDSNSSNGRLSIGFFADDGGLVQRSFAWIFRNAQTDGTAHAQVVNNRVGWVTNLNAATEDYGFELTANGSTTTTITVRSSSANGSIIGGLFDMPNEAYVGSVTSPNATGSWNNNDLSFTPGVIVGALTQMTTINTAVNDSADAGSIGIFATDFTTEVSASAMDENASATSNTKSRLSTELWHGVDTGTEDYACNTFAADSNGWTATCDTADATSHLWPFLAIEEDGGATLPLFMHQRRMRSQ